MIITSNNEKELPDAFLRRCVFHYIEFPDEELMERIVARAPSPNSRQAAARPGASSSTGCASVGLRKKPSTSELIDWIAALLRAGVDPREIDAHIPFIGALLKKDHDVDVAQWALAGGRGRR